MELSAHFITSFLGFLPEASFHHPTIQTSCNVFKRKLNDRSLSKPDLSLRIFEVPFGMKKFYERNLPDLANMPGLI